MSRRQPILSAALFAVLALVVAAALPAAASPPLTKARSLEVYRSVIVNGVDLAAGSYRVELAPSLDRVIFLKGKRSLASAPCRVGFVASPAAGNTVHYRPRQDGKEEIASILFAGSSLSIDLAAAAAEGRAVAEAAPRP